MPSLLTDVHPDYGAVEQPLYGELQVSGADGVPVQERTRRTTPAWRVDLAWTRRSGSAIATLRQSLRTLKTTGAQCYLYTPDRWGYWESVNIGTGDGSTLNFVAGARNLVSGSYTVYVDGVAKTETTHYTVNEAYSDSLDRVRIEFTGGNAPGNGLAVTMSFRGQRLLLAWLVQGPAVTVPGYDQHSLAATFIGTESTGA